MKDIKEEKAEIIQHAFFLGFEYEKTIRGCCQCTIAAIQDALEIQNDAVFRAGSGLTAGGGISCEGSCGGVYRRSYGHEFCLWATTRKVGQ